MGRGAAHTIGWGEPARIADSKESHTCGRCNARRGVYGKHFGIGPDGNPIPVVEEYAFDYTRTKTEIAARCWNCDFSFWQKLSRDDRIVIRKRRRKK